MWEMRVGWPGGGKGAWLWDDGLPLLLPNSDPRMDVDAELGREGWSRGAAALRRVCGLLMMDPCRRREEQHVGQTQLTRLGQLQVTRLSYKTEQNVKEHADDKLKTFP